MLDISALEPLIGDRLSTTQRLGVSGAGPCAHLDTCPSLDPQATRLVWRPVRDLLSCQEHCLQKMQSVLEFYAPALKGLPGLVTGALAFERGMLSDPRMGAEFQHLDDVLRYYPALTPLRDQVDDRIVSANERWHTWMDGIGVDAGLDLLVSAYSFPHPTQEFQKAFGLDVGGGRHSMAYSAPALTMGLPARSTDSVEAFTAHHATRARDTATMVVRLPFGLEGLERELELGPLGSLLVRRSVKSTSVLALSADEAQLLTKLPQNFFWRLERAFCDDSSGVLETAAVLVADGGVKLEDALEMARRLQ